MVLEAGNVAYENVVVEWDDKWAEKKPGEELKTKSKITYLSFVIAFLHWSNTV